MNKTVNASLNRKRTHKVFRTIPVCDGKYEVEQTGDAEYVYDTRTGEEVDVESLPPKIYARIIDDLQKADDDYDPTPNDIGDTSRGSSPSFRSQMNDAGRGHQIR